MIPSNKTFNGKDTVEYNGKKFYRWHNIETLGKYKLIIRFISTNSKYRQGIALFFKNFDGSVSLNGQSLKILKGFKHYIFKFNDFINKELVFEIELNKGYLILGNASEHYEDNFTSGAFGCAFWIEDISNKCTRFHCNDHEYDDDFDDLVFEIEYAD